MSPGASLHIVFDSVKEQKMAYRTFTHLGANVTPADEKPRLRASLRLSCLLPTLFLLVYGSFFPLRLIGAGLWGVVSLEVLLGRGPGDEETVLSYRSVFV